MPANKFDNKYAAYQWNAVLQRVWKENLFLSDFEIEMSGAVVDLYLLNRITTAGRLPDGSRKPGEALWVGIVPDL